MVATAALVLAPSAPAQQSPPPAKFAVGIAVPTSGEFAPLGKQIVESARIAAQDTGARIVVRDTGGEPAGAVKAVSELAADPSVVAVIGPLGIRESQAAAATAQRHGIPLFALTASESVNRAGGWVFRVRSSPAEQATAMADIAVDHLDAKTAAIAYPQITYGNDAAVAFTERFVSRGGRVTAVANYAEDTTNFEGVLDVLVAKKVYLGKKGSVGKWKTDASGFARLKGKPTVDFDVLFVPDFHYRVARLLPFLPVVGIQNGDGGDGVAVQLLGLSGWQGKTMELGGGAAAGALYVDTFAGDAAGGRQEEFSRTFEAVTGRRPVDIEAEAFDIVWLVSQLAAPAAGEREPRAALVRSLPTSRPWTGVAGSLRFGPSGEPIRVLGLYRFDTDGSVVPL